MRAIRRQNQGVTLNCFSPPVMLVTLLVEAALTIYTLWRYKMNDTTRLIAFTLICLGSFQMCEYFVCTGYGLRAEQWSRFGFIMITALPALGIHIMHKVADKSNRRMVWGTYGIMASFMAFFLTYKTAFIGHQCTGNYVIFQMGAYASSIYTVYYYGLLASGIALGVKWANEFKSKGQAYRKKLECVRGLIIGYLVFLIPTALAYSVKPEDRHAIPSIMCGFAVIFALILVFYILPRAVEVKTKSVILKQA